MLGLEGNQNKTSTCSTDYIALIEPNETENDVQILLQRVDDAIESELNKTLGTLANKLANAINGIKDCVISALGSFRSNNIAINASALNHSRVESDVE